MVQINKSLYRQCIYCEHNYLPTAQTASRQKTCGRKRCTIADSKAYQLARPEPKSFKPRDLAIMIKHMNTPRKRAALFLMCRGGLRVGELVKVRVEDVLSRDGGVVDFFTLAARHTKTNRARTVMISPEANEAITKLIVGRTHGPLLPSQRGGGIQERGVQKWIEKIQPLLSEHRTTHGLRHTAGHHWAKAKGLQVAQRVLGHADISQTAHYATQTDHEMHANMFGA